MDKVKVNDFKVNDVVSVTAKARKRYKSLFTGMLAQGTAPVTSGTITGFLKCKTGTLAIMKERLLGFWTWNVEDLSPAEKQS